MAIKKRVPCSVVCVCSAGGREMDGSMKTKTVLIMVCVKLQGFPLLPKLSGHQNARKKKKISLPFVVEKPTHTAWLSRPRLIIAFFSFFFSDFFTATVNLLRSCSYRHRRKRYLYKVLFFYNFSRLTWRRKRLQLMPGLPIPRCRLRCTRSDFPSSRAPV